MNLEKLKPWHWFRDEEQAGTQIPVTKSAVLAGEGSDTALPAPQHSAGSLLQLHRQMDRLFDDVWRSFGLLSTAGRLGESALPDRALGHGARPGTYRANLDVCGDDKGYEVSIDLPGLSEADVHIEVAGQALHIWGEKEAVSESKNKQYYRAERRFGAFQRLLSLPDDADRDAIAAVMKDGVLTIRIPRRAAAPESVRRIPIAS